MRLVLILALMALLFAQPALAQNKPAAADTKEKSVWEEQKSGVEDDLHDVAFVDGKAGFAVGDNQTILKTTDGGQSWRRVIDRIERGGRSELREVQFGSPKEGWAISGVAATILHTADGGESWQSVPLPKDSLALKHKITQAAVGSNYYYLCWGLSGTHLFHTSNAGRTWQELNNQIKLGGVDADARLFFLDAERGWYANLRGIPGRGYLGTTTDGGKSWNEQQLPANRSMRLQFVDKDRGWVLPETGLFLATIDGGKSWSEHKLAPKKPISQMDLHFLNAESGYVVHYADGTKNQPGFEVRHTDDGGKTWNVVGGFVATLNFPRSMAFTAEGEGWLVGKKGYIAHLSAR